MDGTAIAGNFHDRSRSDCRVTLALAQSGGVTVQVNSKVASLYGKSIEALCRQVLGHFSIKNATVLIDDKGALPFVIAARLEAAIRSVVKTDHEFLPELLPVNRSATAKSRERITRLYLPGDNPALMINGGIHRPDAIILDLEDAVAPEKKHDARLLVRNALRALDFLGVERMVRINNEEDLPYVIPHGVNVILIPKCESAAQIAKINRAIIDIQQKMDAPFTVWLMPIIESAMGVMKALEIATAAENVAAVAIGLEDYTADLGVRRTKEGTESLFARCQVVNACKAAGIQAIDSVFSNVNDPEGLKQNVLASRAIGFDGMGCIHPSQIRIVRENFAPDAQEIEEAKKILDAFQEARAKSLGVISLNNKMIDAPVIKRAERTLARAIAAGITIDSRQP